jgi:filamentous hemagglutinin family protein
MDAHKVPLQIPMSRRQTVLRAILLIVAFIPMAPSVGDAQVTTNITSSGLNTQVNQVGNSHNITGGTRPGNGPNLFHSFGNFSLGGGDVANFLNNTGLPTSNILGRVTGGNISNIYGTIQTTPSFGSANLFLMNPSGIMLGPSASLNVGGSVSFTTAQYIRLFDGTNSANFYANPANDGLVNSILTINPSAFEFLSASPAGYGFLTTPDPNATITVQGSTLSVPAEKAIALVGGKVVIEGGANLTAPGGSIKHASAASPGEFDATTLGSLPNADGTSFSSNGSVSLASGSSIEVHGTSTVLIKGGQLMLSVNNATLSTSENPVPPNTIALRSGSSIMTSNSGTEPGADLQLIASNVHLADGSFLITQASGPGHGGNIHLTADSLTFENSSVIATRNSELGQVGGDLVLNVGTLQLLGGDLGGSRIASINNTGTDLDGDGLVDVTGVGGNVTIQGTTQGANSAADSVVLSGGSQITSDAASTGGNGGGVSISATTLDLNGASSVSSSTGGTGQGGNIVVSVRQLRIVDDATISSITSSENLIPAAGGMVTVQGLAGPKSMASSVQLSGPNTRIITDSFAGMPGDITVNAGTVTITNGAAIAAGSSSSTGPAGKVTVTADSVVISAEGQIFSRSFAKNSAQVSITTDELTMDKGSIDTGTSSESGGRGGNVVIQGGEVNLTNSARIRSQSGSEEARFSTGRAGDVTITAESLTLANRSEISSSSKGTEVGAAGDAGNITIQSGSKVLLNHSSITTEAIAASGGQITINAPDMIRLINSPISTSVAGAAGDSNGGNISIDPQFVILQGSPILARAFAGSGGAIDITAGLFLADPASTVDASSTLGVSGTVQINAPINNLSSVVARLPESLLAVQTLLRAACAAKLAQGATSSFVERGRDGIPTGPDGMLASPYLPITSERSVQLRGKPSIGQSGIQLRRLLGKDIPSSITLIPDHAACSS